MYAPRLGTNNNLHPKYIGGGGMINIKK